MDNRQGFIKGMRQLLDLFESNPEIEIPFSLFTILNPVHSRAGLLKQRKAMGGTWVKSTDGVHFNLVRNFGPIAYQIYVQREAVCERVKVDTIVKKVEEYDADALRSVPKVTKTVLEDVYEWICPDSILEGTTE